jgi:two-component system chemotaxis response regulator CheY
MKTVLLADDSKVVRDMLSTHFRSEGYQVVEYTDGIDAWEAMSSEKVTPHICLLDLNMPKLGGLEVCEKMRSVERLKDLPVLLVTAQSDPALKEKAKSLGVRGWVLKPVIPATVASVVKKLLG